VCAYVWCVRVCVYACVCMCVCVLVHVCTLERRWCASLHLGTVVCGFFGVSFGSCVCCAPGGACRQNPPYTYIYTCVRVRACAIVRV